MAHTGQHVGPNNFELRTQFPIFKQPPQRVSEEAPGHAAGSSTFGDRLRRFKSPAWLRRVIPAWPDDRRPEAGPLTGSIWDFAGDPMQHGRLIEPADATVGFTERDVRAASGSGGGSVERARGRISDDLDRAHDDITEQVQSHDSEEHRSLRSVRASFPGIKVRPLPAGRCVVLTATAQQAELFIPSSATLMQITWSGMTSGVDLLLSITGGIVAPTTAQPNNPGAYDGYILNPDWSAMFYVKGKKAITVMVPAATLQFVNPTIVNAQFYENN